MESFDNSDKMTKMQFPIKVLPVAEHPPLLREIAQPPTELNYRGTLPSPDLKLLTVVGSRKYTSYGKQVVDDLIGGLRGYRVGIVSGMALGIDSLAHEAALRNDLYTLSIPGAGLSDVALYPATHKPLARKILESGGGLLSEFDPEQRAAGWTFPQRNRLVAGISRATLLIEATQKSGTLITARLAADGDRELLVVPGSIFSKQHEGIHQFLKLGATPVTNSKDILEVLNIDTSSKPTQETIALPALTENESKVLAALNTPKHRDELIRELDLQTSEASQLLMMMEISGHVVNQDNVYRAAR